MGGRAVATIHGHAAALKRSVGNCQLIQKTPTIPPQGPMPLTDPVGMGLVVELLFHSLTAKPCIKGESHIQFDSMRRPRATFTSAWESSPARRDCAPKSNEGRYRLIDSTSHHHYITWRIQGGIRVQIPPHVSSEHHNIGH